MTLNLCNTLDTASLFQVLKKKKIFLCLQSDTSSSGEAEKIHTIRRFFFFFNVLCGAFVRVAVQALNKVRREMEENALLDSHEAQQFRSDSAPLSISSDAQIQNRLSRKSERT